MSSARDLMAGRAKAPGGTGINIEMQCVGRDEAASSCHLPYIVLGYALVRHELVEGSCGVLGIGVGYGLGLYIIFILSALYLSEKNIPRSLSECVPTALVPQPVVTERCAFSFCFWSCRVYTNATLRLRVAGCGVNLYKIGAKKGAA